jgi:hypothetical protein
MKSAAALENKVGGQFLNLVTKTASFAIWVTSPLKHIGRPNTTFNYQPSKGFALRGILMLPIEGGHERIWFP